MSNKKRKEDEAKNKEEFKSFLLNCDLEQLYTACNRTIVNSARNFYGSHLKIKNDDPYSAYNSYFIATEEAVKAFNLMVILFQRTDNINISDSILENVYFSFKSHQPKINTLKRIMEASLILNGVVRGYDAIRDLEKKLDDMFEKNKIYTLKNYSIYVSVDTENNEFVFPENKITKKDATFLKALCMEVNRLNRYLMNLENENRTANKLTVFPLDEETNKYRKKS